MVLIAVWVLLALVAVAGLVTITIGWGHDAWASTEVEGNIKTVQAIVLGLGFLGVVAGAVVTYRRQQTMQDQLDQDRRKYQLELDKFEDEQGKYAREQVRETERRQQERYAQGAQMLADQSPAVRIAGLNVIAALGREVGPEEEQRQTCLNLICAYLRASSPATPSTPPEVGQQKPDSVPDDVYRVVAAEACRLLPTLLEEAPEADGNAPPPRGLDLDLRQVHLIDLNLRGRHLGTVRCDNATFSGYTGFVGATFEGYAGFDKAMFSGDAGFVGATFTRLARFVGATFEGYAGFDEATFEGYARFDKARCSGDAWFNEARFSGVVWFDEARFSGLVWFDKARFSRDVWFVGAMFSRDAGFDKAAFNGDVGFDKARFSGLVGFDGATFVKVDGPESLGAADFAASEPFEGAVFGRPQQPDDDGEEDASSLDEQG